MKTSLFKNIEKRLQTLNPKTLSAARTAVLQPLIDFIQQKVDQQEAVRLHFICTHNSRRSILSQVWAQVMATHFDIPNVVTYSGGTQATAVFPFVVETLTGQGFEITPLSEGENPVYAISMGANHLPVMAFSKTYDHPFNPRSDFAAIMTCDQADENCPFIPGAEQRIPIPYADPKTFDGTPMQAQKYDKRSLQIATELHYVFSKISPP
jgi:arsenate reductase